MEVSPLKYRLRELSSPLPFDNGFMHIPTDPGTQVYDLDGIHPRDALVFTLMRNRRCQFQLYKLYQVFPWVGQARPTGSCRTSHLMARLASFMLGPLPMMGDFYEFAMNCDILHFGSDVSCVIYNPSAFKTVLKHFPPDCLEWDCWSELLHPFHPYNQDGMNPHLIKSGIPEHFHRKIIQHQAIQVDNNHEIGVNFSRELEGLPIPNAYALLNKTKAKSTVGTAFLELSQALRRRAGPSGRIRLPKDAATKEAILSIYRRRRSAKMHEFCRNRIIAAAELELRKGIALLLFHGRDMLDSLLLGVQEDELEFKVYKEMMECLLGAKLKIAFLVDKCLDVSHLLEVLESADDLLFWLTGLRLTPYLGNEVEMLEPCCNFINQPCEESD